MTTEVLEEAATIPGFALAGYCEFGEQLVQYLLKLPATEAPQEIQLVMVVALATNAQMVHQQAHYWDDQPTFLPLILAEIQLSWNL